MGKSSAERVAAYRARRRELGLVDTTRKDAARIKREYRALHRLGPDPHARPEHAIDAGRPFTGCDGEGSGTDAIGRQNYMLFRMGERELYTGKPLTTHEVLNFICDHPAKEILVGFSFGYDTSMILRDLPPDRLARLMGWRYRASDDPTAEPKLEKIPRVPGSRYSPLTWFKEFDIEYLARNYLKVRRVRIERDPDTGEQRRIGIPGSTRTIYETFGFFQKSFLRTINEFKIGTDEERRRIELNKAARSTFEEMTPEVRAYCALECRMLGELMEQLRGYCIDAGIVPRTWSGAGKLAAAMHKDHATPTREMIEGRPARGEQPPIAALVPEGVRNMAAEAYYGGRFEISRVGHVGRCHEYDINSAYPAAMRSLPCLVHGKWKRAERDELKRHAKQGGLYIANIVFRFDDQPEALWAGLPIRGSNGGLYFPRRGEGVYWSCEIESAERLGMAITLKRGYLYEKRCECCPFDWIEPLYEYRKSLGASTAGYPIKLGTNSLYGKLVQRLGSATYFNAVWGGLITAITRAKLNDAIALAPSSIVMIATDGIYSRVPLDLPIGGALGQWDHNPLDSLFIVQPGLYWSPDRKKKKSRGLPGKFFEEPGRVERFERAWARFRHGELSGKQPRFPAVSLPIDMFIGLRVAIARGKPELAGRWVTEVKHLSFDYRGKRSGHTWDDRAIVTGLIRGYPGLRSVPSKAIAQHFVDDRDELRIVVEDQPELIELGVPFDDDLID